jgi:hypothetical protein
MSIVAFQVVWLLHHGGEQLLSRFALHMMNYILPNLEGRILANQRVIVVGDFLGTFAGIKGTPGIEGIRCSLAKRLKRKQVVV